MLKTLSAYIGEYKRVSIKTPIYIIVEVLMEILIPFVTASIIAVSYTHLTLPTT